LRQIDDPRGIVREQVREIRKERQVKHDEPSRDRESEEVPEDDRAGMATEPGDVPACGRVRDHDPVTP
ncbi:MAG: hypothetical protein NT062_29575, partial [Proteobacteria bacterium]|nr:hypothetical protein [Pseudomonadota bacterium]